MGLTIGQLFVPLASGVVEGVTPTTVQPGTWLANVLALSASQSPPLPATQWQSGGIAWTEFLVWSSTLTLSDANISLIAQGGLLDFAATGSVSYTNPQGVVITIPVTPDPSDPSQNPTGAIGWLDVFADNYGIGTGNADGRIKATNAVGNEYLVNTSGTSFGTFVAGNFHVANAVTGATYTNTAGFAFTPSSVAGTSVTAVTYGANVSIHTSAPHGLTLNQVVYVSGVTGLSSNWAQVTPTTANDFTMTGVLGSGVYTGTAGRVWIPITVPFIADLTGPGSNAAPGAITQTITSVPGAFVTNLANAWSGQPYETNVQLAARCRATLQSWSPNGASGAYFVAAITASAILAAQTPPKALTQAITRVLVTASKVTGANSVIVANSGGAVPGVANLLVTGATNASPIVCAVPTTAGLTTGMVGTVSGVQGNSAANGYWTFTVVDGTHVSLNGSTGNGAYLRGGVVEAGDLGLVDSVEQSRATPNAVTTVTTSAQNLVVNVVATVFVPSAFVSDYVNAPSQPKGAVALASLFPLLPIGGTVLPGTSQGIVDYSQISALLFESGQSAGQVYTDSVQNLTLNGIGASLPVGGSQVPVLGSVALTVVPV